jgi:hypothetical protein
MVTITSSCQIFTVPVLEMEAMMMLMPDVLVIDFNVRLIMIDTGTDKAVNYQLPLMIICGHQRLIWLV